MPRLTAILLSVVLACSALALQKNIGSQKWVVFAFDLTTNAPKTGDASNITATVYLDGSSNAVDDTNPTELGGGYYVFDLAQGETNADNIVIVPASSTTNIQVIGCPAAVWTVAATPAVNVTQWSGTNVATVDTAGYPKVTVKAGTGTGELSLSSGIVAADAVQISGDATAANNAELAFDGTGFGFTNCTMPTVTTLTTWDKTGYSLTQAFPSNFASLAITAGGAVTAGTVSDKTGYALTQSFPSNFGSLAITAGGAVTVGTNSDKTGYALAADQAVNVTKIAGAAVDASAAQIGVNVVNWKGSAAPDNTGDAFARIGVNGAGLTALPWNSAWDAEVQSEVDDALKALYLDKLFAADYDPASKPGTATALLNELIENDGGVSRLTANALENSPAGTGGFTADDRTKLEAMYGKLPSKAYLTGTANADGDVQMNEATGNFPGSVASVAGAVFEVSNPVTVGLNNDKTGYGLTAAYDPAKTAAQAGDQMDLVNAPNATAVTALQTGLATAAALSTVDTVADAIRAKTDNLPADPASNTQVNTRLATAGYTAPDNASIAAILTDTGTTLPAQIGGLNNLSAAEVKTALEADGSKLDHLWEMTEDNGGARRFTANALEEAPAGGGDAMLANQTAMITALGVIQGVTDKLDTALETDGLVYRLTANALELSPASAAGTGPIEWTYTLTDSTTGLPIAGAVVMLYTDEARTNLVASATTNAGGVATFYLTAGTYYIVAYKAGYNFTIPDPEVVE